MSGAVFTRAALLAIGAVCNYGSRAAGNEGSAVFAAVTGMTGWMGRGVTVNGLALQVQMVKMTDLRQHLPRDCLPEHLGGLLSLDAHGWNQQLLAGQNGRADPVDELVGVPLGESSIHVPGPEAVSLTEFAAHLGRAQRAGIYQQYDDIRKESPSGTFHCAL